MHHETNAGDHSQTAILEFLELQFPHVALGTHAERVEAIVNARFVGLLEGHQLNDSNSDENLDPAFDGDSVDSLEGVGLGEHGARKVDELLDKHSGDGEHSDAAILELAGGGVVLIDVIRQVQRVEAVVTNAAAVEL